MNILFVTDSDYPEGNAPAIRFHYLMKSLIYKGHKCKMVCMGKKAANGFYDGVPYVSFRNPPATKFKTAVMYFMYPIKLLNILRTQRFDGVLCSQPINPFVFKIIEHYGRKTGCVIVQNMMDWFSAENYSSKLNYDYVSGNFYTKKLTRPPWRVLAISRMLEEYFIEKGCRTVRVPALMDFSAIKHKEKEQKNKLIISYAGHPGTKDYMGTILKAICRLPLEERSRIEFNVMGPSEEELLGISELNEEEKNISTQFLKCFSGVSRVQVLERLQDSDFTILIRDSEKQYAKAGFPTKVVESLATGTPVICNYSSDLKFYLKDMVNAIIVKDHTVESVADAIKKALMLSYDEIKCMGNNAYKIGCEKLDYHVFAAEVEKIFQK